MPEKKGENQISRLKVEMRFKNQRQKTQLMDK